MQKRIAFAMAAVLLAAGCSGQQNANQGGGQTPPPSLHNPLDFPLYPNASMVSSHAFTQNVQVASQTGQSIFEGGNGTYTGHEVIASTNAPFSQLASWLDRLITSPPDGYAAVETGQNPQARTQALQYGLDYATFKKKDGTRERGLLIIVMDPQRVNEKFGRILGMIAKYRALPGVMRAPIDNEAKARIGMTITEATQPDSPIGAALAALDQFQHKSARGIVMLDAVKR